MLLYVANDNVTVISNIQCNIEKSVYNIVHNSSSQY